MDAVKTRASLKALVAVFVVLLAACGGTSETGSADVATDAVDAGTSTEDSVDTGSSEDTGGGDGELTTVTALAAPVAFEPLHIADREGIFADYGLEVDIQQGGTADAQIPQLLNNEAQFGMTAAVAVTNAVAEGIPVRMLLSNLNSGDPDSSALLTPPDSGIEAAADLEGATVAVGGLQDTTQLATMMGADAAGVDPDSITFVEVPLPSMVQALGQGDVDAAFTIEPFRGLALGEGNAQVEGTAVGELLGGSPAVAWAVSDQWAQDNPEVAESFVDAMCDAIDLGLEQPELIRELDRELTELPEDYIANRPIPNFACEINLDATQVSVDAMETHGYIDVDLSAEDVISEFAPTN